MPRNIITYQNTIIYKIVCNDLSIKDLYVGHTTDFVNRKRNHRNRTNNFNDENGKFKIYVTIRANGGWNNWSMIEVEKFPCNDGNEARSRERYWYELLNANLNVDYPNRTNKEYREMNHEVIKERKRNYYARNKEEQLIKKNEKILCPDCGVYYTYSNKNKHIKRNPKHIEFLKT